jgi:3-oxoacyl-[acyl-carrier protein] reductase
MAEKRVALVTGGGRGIGFACVKRLLSDGLRVAIVEISDKATEAATAELRDFSADLRFFSASVTDRTAITAAVASVVQTWGRLDVLVNNAAVNRLGGIRSQSDDDWAAVIGVNLTGVFVTTSVATGPMVEHGWGAIVNVGSIGAAGFGASPAYAASKAGLTGLTKQVARELGPSGITANLVAPGVTTTEWVARNMDPAGTRATADATPTRRLGTPEDIAGVVSFLAGNDSRHVTGQVISASGGYWMP